jgi:hypothetical protein
MQPSQHTQYEAWRQQAAKRMPMLLERVYSLRKLFCQHVDEECQCELESTLESLIEAVCCGQCVESCAKCMLIKMRYRKLVMDVWKAEHGKH